jgi:hypothetical protein
MGDYFILTTSGLIIGNLEKMAASIYYIKLTKKIVLYQVYMNPGTGNIYGTDI